MADTATLPQQAYDLFKAGFPVSTVAADLGVSFHTARHAIEKHRAALTAAGLPVYKAVNGCRPESRPWHTPPVQKPPPEVVRQRPGCAPGHLLTEDEVADLYDGQRYDDYLIRTRGIGGRPLRRPDCATLAGSSMGGLW